MHPLGLLCLTPLRLADIAEHGRPPVTPRAAAEDLVTCVEPAALARADGLGSGFDLSVETEHFLVAWQSTNAAVTEDALAVYTAALEASWTHEVDERGWKAPDQTDACRMTVLLTELDASWGDTGGYTDVVEEGGVPYIVLNTAWLEYGDDWTNTLVAHEFNHASQFAYGVFWDPSDFWYWEATAEWVPDALYDDANTYTWSLWSYLDQPWRPLDSMFGTVQYGHFAFNVHLEEAWDADMPRAVWAAADGESRMREAVEAATGAAFDEVVAGYSSRVAAIDVEERDVWLEALGYFEIDPWTHVTNLPAEGGLEGRGTPQQMGQNFLHFQVDAAEGFTFDFNGLAVVGPAPVDWILAVAEVQPGGAITHAWSRADADGAATLTVGAGATDVYIALVPFGEIGENGASYTWSAEAGAPADPDGPAGPGKDGETPAACGCDTPDAPVTALLAAAGVFAVRRRRPFLSR